MGVENAKIRYVCDWRDEHNEPCEHEAFFSGVRHESAATAEGWGSYSNATIRRNDGRRWFCPLHATVFGNNHGWGGLESYTPPAQNRRRRWLR